MADTIVRVVNGETRVVVAGAEFLAPYVARANAAADEAEAHLANFPSYYKGDKGDPGAKGDQGFPGNTLVNGAATYATRSAIAVQDGAAVGSAILTEVGRAGKFAWRTGNFSTFVSADTRQGIYIAPASDTTGASGAWVRQFDGPVNVLWFGFVGDYNGTTGTDNLAAFNAMMAALKPRAKVGLSTAFNVGTDAIYVPPGRYYFSGTLEFLELTTHVIGATSGLGGGEPSQFIFAPNVDGIRIQAYNTQTNGARSPTGMGADGTIIQGLAVYAQAGSTVGNGIWLRARASIIDCRFYNFGESGIKIRASATATHPSDLGNANGWYVSRVLLTSNGYAGLYVDGPDVNAGMSELVNASYNGSYGIYDSSFLGNAHYAAHVDQVGVKGLGNQGNNAVLNATAQVSNGTYVYTVRPGQAVGASTNAPPAGPTSNQWWLYYGGGGAHPVYPLWVSGILTKEGAPYKSDDPNSLTRFVDCYSEGGQPPLQIDWSASAVGGAHGSGYGDSSGSISRVEGGRMLFNRGAGGRSGTGGKTIAYVGGDAAYTISDPDFALNGYAEYVQGGDLIGLRSGGFGVFLLSGDKTTQQFGTAAPKPDVTFFYNLALPSGPGEGPFTGRVVHRAAWVGAPTGGTTVDTECRAQLAAVLTALKNANLMSS